MQNENKNQMTVYSFSQFGYEGSLITVESDLRRGIPAIDIVGLADGAVKETRERMKSAIVNSGYEFPMERILISLSPADLRKEGAGFDLPIAISILSHGNNFVAQPVMIIGELELSGRVLAVRGVHAAVMTGLAAGIQYFVVAKGNEEEAKIQGAKILSVENLCDAVKGLKDVRQFVDYTGTGEEMDEEGISFDTSEDDYFQDMKLPVSVLNKLTIAASGRHNLMLVGAPGCGKTMAMQLMKAITPKLTMSEASVTTRIHSLAGLMSPAERIKRVPPFRMPHQTASIEGICGGGPNCRPGEISLAHNGMLFLDEASEFRSSVLQMLRVPLEGHSITLSRAGRSTVYPANFQLLMAVNPCPCGNYGSSERICLCSAKAVAQYWHKFSDPLLSRIELKGFVKSEEEKVPVNLSEIREKVARAYEKQRRLYGKHNSELTPYELSEYAKTTDEALCFFDDMVSKEELSERKISSLLKVALTVSQMNGHELIEKSDIESALCDFSILDIYADVA